MALNEEQSAFVLLYVIFLLIASWTDDTIVARPIRLLTTFIHEFSHALACWLTGGKLACSKSSPIWLMCLFLTLFSMNTIGEVREIEVHTNASGVTRYRGGCRCIIASAGYLGEAFWGMIAVILSGGRKTATFAAGGLILALSITMCYRPNRTLVVLTVSYILILGVFIFLEWYVFTPLLTYIILYFGVFFGYLAIADIADHQVAHTRVGSDAYHLYIESGRCCPPRCVGCWWLINAIMMQIVGALVAVMQLSEDCKDDAWMECIFDTHFEFNMNWNGWFHW